uniref:Uncharacterized protein n=1 Tax=Anguilla anguilla TaxID=7936 RepID=A0A0E9WX71_ANGAN
MSLVFTLMPQQQWIIRSVWSLTLHTVYVAVPLYMIIHSMRQFVRKNTKYYTFLKICTSRYRIYLSLLLYTTLN